MHSKIGLNIDYNSCGTENCAGKKIHFYILTIHSYNRVVSSNKHQIYQCIFIHLFNHTILAKNEFHRWRIE